MDNFKCFRCDKDIDSDCEIYFAQDRSFCTFDCRDNHLNKRGDYVDYYTSVSKPFVKSKSPSNSFTKLFFQSFKRYTSFLC